MKLWWCGLLVLAVACRPAPAKPRHHAEVAAAAPTPQRNPTGRWHVVAVSAQLEVAPDQALPGLTQGALETALQAAVHELPMVATMATPPADWPQAAQAGVGVVVAWQRLNGEHAPVAAAAPACDGDLRLMVTAEVQQPMPKG